MLFMIMRNMIYKIGRIDEKILPLRYNFGDGLVPGLKSTLEMTPMGAKMFFHHRMKLLPERKIKGIKTLRKMLDKAEKMGKGGARA